MKPSLPPVSSIGALRLSRAGRRFCQGGNQASALGYDPIWFGVISLLNIQLGLISPPFGLDEYTLKAVAPQDVSLGTVFRSSMPFMGLGFVSMILLLSIPSLATWLPSVTGK